MPLPLHAGRPVSLGETEREEGEEGSIFFHPASTLLLYTAASNSSPITPPSTQRYSSATSQLCDPTAPDAPTPLRRHYHHLRRLMANRKEEARLLNIYGPRIWSQASQQHSWPFFPPRRDALEEADYRPLTLTHFAEVSLGV